MQVNPFPAMRPSWTLDYKDSALSRRLLGFHHTTIHCFWTPSHGHLECCSSLFWVLSFLRSRSLWSGALFPLAPQHQTGGSEFAIKDPSLEGKNFSNGYKNMSKKHMMLNKHRRWFHSFLENFPLVRMSASWFLGVNIFDLDFRIQVDPIKQPTKSDTVSSRHMSQSGTSSFHYNLDHGFVVLTDVQLWFPLRRTRVGGYAVQFVQLITPCFLLTRLVLVLESSSWVEHTQLSLS